METEAIRNTRLIVVVQLHRVLLYWCENETTVHTYWEFSLLTVQWKQHNFFTQKPNPPTICWIAWWEIRRQHNSFYGETVHYCKACESRWMNTPTNAYKVNFNHSNHFLWTITVIIIKLLYFNQRSQTSGNTKYLFN